MEFPTTMWSEIARACDASPEALERLLGRYRPPVCAYFRAQGLQSADAEDLTQEVFRRILEQDLLGRADRERGRFRGMLRGIARNVLREDARRRHAQKRGGDHLRVPLDDLPEAAESDPSRPRCEDEEFDGLWVRHLIEEALRAAEADDRAPASGPVAFLRLRVFDGLGHEALAARFGLKIQDVKNRLHAGRKRVAAHLKRLVRAYASSAEEYAAELALVGRFVERRGASDELP